MPRLRHVAEPVATQLPDVPTTLPEVPTTLPPEAPAEVPAADPNLVEASAAVPAPVEAATTITTPPPITAGSDPKITPMTVSSTYFKWVSNYQRDSYSTSNPRRYMDCSSTCIFAYFSDTTMGGHSWSAVNGGSSTTYLCKGRNYNIGDYRAYAGTATGTNCVFRKSATTTQSATNMECLCVDIPPNWSNGPAAVMWVTDGNPPLGTANYRICKFGSVSTNLMGYTYDSYCRTPNKVDKIENGASIMRVGAYTGLSLPTTV